ncbi:hypothetical protein FMN50_13600 [Rhodobacterales bacterium]|nr:hypothetical protein FMN50_13600 [Rhodobacterales bacterium]
MNTRFLFIAFLFCIECSAVSANDYGRFIDAISGDLALRSANDRFQFKNSFPIFSGKMISDATNTPAYHALSKIGGDAGFLEGYGQSAEQNMIIIEYVSGKVTDYCRFSLDVNKKNEFFPIVSRGAWNGRIEVSNIISNGYENTSLWRCMLDAVFFFYGTTRRDFFSGIVEQDRFYKPNYEYHLLEGIIACGATTEQLASCLKNR